MLRQRLQPTAPSPINKHRIEQVTRVCVPLVRTGFQAMAPLHRRGHEHVLEGPALVLANHASLLDPVFMITAAARPIHFLATAAAMQQPVMGRVLQVWGSVPKKKFTVDAGAIRTLKKWVDLGAMVGSYPEGERSWDGRLLPLLPGIESLVRLLKIPVLPVRILNADRVMPRWAEVRRHGPVTVEFGAPQSFARKTPPAQIRAWLEQQLHIDPADASCHAPVRSRGRLAAGIDIPLYRCMSCFAWDSLVSSGDEIRCGSCRASWRVDTANALQASGAAARSMTIVEARDLLAARKAEGFFMDERAFETSGRIATSERAELLDVSGELIRSLGHGRLELDQRALRVVDAQGGTLLELPLAEIARSIVELRRRLTFRTKDGRLYELVLPRESPLKWTELVEHWRVRAQSEQCAAAE